MRKLSIALGIVPIVLTALAVSVPAANASEGYDGNGVDIMPAAWDIGGRVITVSFVHCPEFPAVGPLHFTLDTSFLGQDQEVSGDSCAPGELHPFVQSWDSSGGLDVDQTYPISASISGEWWSDGDGTWMHMWRGGAGDSFDIKVLARKAT
jgi:hypothetical protein